MIYCSGGRTLKQKKLPPPLYTLIFNSTRHATWFVEKVRSATCFPHLFTGIKIGRAQPQRGGRRKKKEKVNGMDGSCVWPDDLQHTYYVFRVTCVRSLLSQLLPEIVFFKCFPVT